MFVYLHRLNSFLQGEQTGKTRETKDAKLFGLQPKEKRNTNTHIKFLASANRIQRKSEYRTERESV